MKKFNISRAGAVGMTLGFGVALVSVPLHHAGQLGLDAASYLCCGGVALVQGLFLYEFNRVQRQTVAARARNDR